MSKPMQSTQLRFLILRALSGEHPVTLTQLRSEIGRVSYRGAPSHRQIRECLGGLRQRGLVSYPSGGLSYSGIVITGDGLFLLESLDEERED